MVVNARNNNKLYLKISASLGRVITDTTHSNYYLRLIIHYDVIVHHYFYVKPECVIKIPLLISVAFPGLISMNYKFGIR